MEIIGERKFVDVPGDKKHELPPLLVQTSRSIKRLERAVDVAATIIEDEEMIALSPLEEIIGDHDHDRRKMDLAINLVDQYITFVQHWQWGHSILEWIRQCEITFESRMELRHLLTTDIWPHAGRASFVHLLADKDVKPQGVGLEEAVGLGLTFRQPPPLKCFSNQFLFYLNSPVGTTAYHTWAQMTPSPVSCLPPERFSFQVVEM